MECTSANAFVGVCIYMLGRMCMCLGICLRALVCVCLCLCVCMSATKYPRELFRSHSLEQILFCIYTICQYGQILTSCTVPGGLPFP